MMQYIVVSNVRKRVKELGFKTNMRFLFALDAMVETMIERAAVWTKPDKIIKQENLINFLARHHIKL